MNVRQALFSKTRPEVYLLLITLAGILLRIMAFRYNELPHGDIHLDYAAAWGLLNKGRLEVPFVTQHHYSGAYNEPGYPVNQHAPIWPILGAMGTGLFGNIFESFKVVSLLSGILLIPFSYLAFRKSYGEESALLASACIAVSYVLVDYSGNGSLYMLHTLLFLLFVLAIRADRYSNSIFVGMIMGLSYLLNYQASILPLALIAVYLVKYGIGKRLLQKLPFLLLSLVVSALVISPWLIRNVKIFGSPFYSIYSDYFLNSLGYYMNLGKSGDDPVLQGARGGFPVVSAVKAVLYWSVRNLVYLCGRVVVLAPVVSLFVPFGIWGSIKRERLHPASDASLSVLMVAGLHIAISCLWPVFKFRYFVPLLPLIIGLGAFGLSIALQKSRFLLPVQAITLVAFVFVDVVTYLRVPSHTNYYDSNEFFRYRTGEAEWQTQERLLRDAALELNKYPESPVIAPIPVFYYTHRTLITATTIIDPEIIRSLIETYGAHYILDEISRVEFYAEFLDFDVVYQNERYALLEINWEDQNWSTLLVRPIPGTNLRNAWLAFVRRNDFPLSIERCRPASNSALRHLIPNQHHVQTPAHQIYLQDSR